MKKDEKKFHRQFCFFGGMKKEEEKTDLFLSQFQGWGITILEKLKSKIW